MEAASVPLLIILVEKITALKMLSRSLDACCASA